MQRDDSIVGEEFGDLLVLKYEKSVKPHPKSQARTHWRCRCLICGREKLVLRSNLISGNTLDCGCQWGLRKKISEQLGCKLSWVSTVLIKGKRNCPDSDLARKILKLAHEMGVQNKKYSSPKKRLDEEERWK